MSESRLEVPVKKVVIFGDKENRKAARIFLVNHKGLKSEIVTEEDRPRDFRQDEIPINADAFLFG